MMVDDDGYLIYWIYWWWIMFNWLTIISMVNATTGSRWLRMAARSPLVVHDVQPVTNWASEVTIHQQRTTIHHNEPLSTISYYILMLYIYKYAIDYMDHHGPPQAIIIHTIFISCINHLSSQNSPRFQERAQRHQHQTLAALRSSSLLKIKTKGSEPRTGSRWILVGWFVSRLVGLLDG